VVFGRRRRTVDDFDAEISAHVQLEIDRLQHEEGLSADAARAAALRTFGNVTRVEERFYESTRALWWDHLRQDLRYAIRTLRKAPGFATTAIATMAIAIGATSAIFTLVDATLLGPLPYPHDEQLVSVTGDRSGVGVRNVGISVPEWWDLQRTGIFDAISPAQYDENNLTGGSRPLRVSLDSVAPNYFEVLGVRPQLGTTFDPNDRTPGYLLQVVISDGLWKRVFGGDPHVIGKTIWLDTDSYRVIGVMPPSFHAPGRTPNDRSIDVWAALGYHGAPMPEHPARNVSIGDAIARLKPGLTVDAAQRQIDALVAALGKEFPSDYPADAGWTLRLTPLKQVVVGDVRQPLLLLLGAVTLVLLVACVNIANLQLARSSARRREMAIRQALGAGRGRLARQLITESVLLSVAGGAAGVVLLVLAQPALLRLIPDTLPRLADVSIDGRVLAFAALVSLAAGIIFGCAPALQVRRIGVSGTLGQQGRGTSASRDQARARRTLVITEFALSLVLMVAAALLLRSFWQLLHVDLGFTPARVMTVRTRLPYPNNPDLYAYATPSKQSQLVREILRRVRSLPGVEQAAMANMIALPLDHDIDLINTMPLTIEGRPLSSQVRQIKTSVVTPEYFAMLDMRLRRGRWLNEFDKEGTVEAAVVNESAARAFWPTVDPIGKRFKLSLRPGTGWVTIVGIAADARTESLETPHVPEVFTSLYQRRDHHLAVMLRGQLDPAAIERSVRDQVQSIDPSLPVFGARQMDDVVSGSLEARRFSLEIVGLFAMTTLVLAAIGIYGVLSFLVGERTREIGIRLALGARREAILRTVLGEGIRLAIAGTVTGLAGALFVARAMARVLYGVSPTDAPTFAGMALLLLSVALLACYVPARRALRVDPMVALRLE
jgi:predicted permease